MAVRFYLGNQTAAVSPAFNANWEDNASEVRRTLSRTKIGTNTSRTVAETSTTNPFDVGVVQFVSDVVAVRAGTISGSFDACFAGVESDAAADSFYLFGFAVFSGDGLTSRGGSSFLDGLEIPTTTTAQQLTATLSAPINVQVGDRLVFEVGYRATNTVATSYSGTVRYGGTDATDLVAGDTGTNASTRAGWVSIPDAWADLFIGLPMLRNSGVTAYLAVEAAWGADLTASSSTWVWSDITEDVVTADRISVSHGKRDEASTSQPATCQLTLDNRSGDYSLGGQSANWPYVRRNTPIRVRVDPGTGSYSTLFQGGADTWAPSWDLTGGWATVQLSASGKLRQLAQGKAPVMSPFKRAMLAKTDMVAYWPCEEEEGAVRIASALDGGLPITISGNIESPFPKWGECTGFISSRPLPVANRTTWRGSIPRYTSTGAIQLRFMAEFPRDPLITTECTFLRLYVAGTLARWDMVYINANAGNFALRGFSTSGARVVDAAVQFALNDTKRWYSLELQQSGGNVAWAFRAMGYGYFQANSISGTANTQTIGAATALFMAPRADADKLGIGQITVQNAISSMNSDTAPLNAHDFETATERITRLCTENGVPLAVAGSSDIYMGPQRNDTLVNLLREAEATDNGLLFDGVGPGLAYIAGFGRFNDTAALTLNAATGQTVLEPVDDDQATRNKVTAKNQPGGSEDTYEDADGPLGTDAIGIYDDTLTINQFYPANVVDAAGLAVARGTVTGYRYPQLDMALHRDPSLASTWLATLPGDRVDVTNPTTSRTQHPAGTVSLVLQGSSQQLDQYRWDATLNCSPHQPWRAGTWAATTGDTTEFVQRVEGDGSTLAAAAAAGATSLSVATPSGPLWTTVADDAPFDIEVGGIRVTVTAVAGAASPQTFTVTGATVTKALTSGSTVALWRPVAPGQ